MVKKPTANSASSSKQLARKEAVGKRKTPTIGKSRKQRPTSRSTSMSKVQLDVGQSRSTRKTATKEVPPVRRVRPPVQWPSQQQLAEIVRVCEAFVRCLKETVLPRMPMRGSHRKSPLVNPYAISEALSNPALLDLIDQVEAAFYTRYPEHDEYIRQHPRLSKFLHPFPTLWHHTVAVPARHLWNTVAALLVFCRRDVFSLASWYKTADGWQREYEHILESPDETNFGDWLDEAVKLCQQLRQVVGLQAPLSGTRARKLQKAFDYIKANQPTIGKAVAAHIVVNYGTFRRHYVDRLEELGVRNEPGKGYVFP